MEFQDGEIAIEKPPNALDELLLAVTAVLEDVGIEYAVVSGYVAVLLGRARATEDIDVLVERPDVATAEELVDALRDAGFWGSAMPLEDLHETFEENLPVRVAEDGHRVPNVELQVADDEWDRRSLAETVTVRFGDRTFVIGGLELQIAYKLDMGAQRDLEDALYLYRVAEPNLDTERLERYVVELGVETEYERLTRS